MRKGYAERTNELAQTIMEGIANVKRSLENDATIKL